MFFFVGGGHTACAFLPLKSFHSPQCCSWVLSLAVMFEFSGFSAILLNQGLTSKVQNMDKDDNCEYMQSVLSLKTM